MTTFPPVSSNETALQKYATAGLMVATVGGGGLAALFVSLFAPNADVFTRITATLVWLALVLGAVGQYAVPLLSGKWAARGKVAIAILTALLAFGAPFIKGSFDFTTDVPLIVVGVLNIVTTQLGVIVRTDGAVVQTKVIVAPVPAGSVAEAPELPTPASSTVAPDDGPQHSTETPTPPASASA